MSFFLGGKKADTELLPYQKRVSEKLQTQPGLVAYFGTGKGKSLAALGAVKNLNKPATAVTPAALKENLLKEQKKHFQQELPIDIESLENVARKQKGKTNPFLIVDEAHLLRDPHSKSLAGIKNMANEAEKTLLLTGTPMVNSPSDIAPLVNLAAKDKILPENKEEFEKKYLYRKQVNPPILQKLKGIKPGEKLVVNKNEEQNLRNIFSKWVDYEKGNTEGFPSVEEQEIEVPMSKSQLALYDTIMGQAPPWVSAKVRANLPPSKQESAQLNAYLVAARQLANSTGGYIDKGEAESPKIQRAYQELKKILDTDPQAKGVIYSNFLGSGLDPYKQLLDKDQIPYGEFTGRVPQDVRDQHIRDYNEGKLKALLISGAGQRGLDLKGTSLMQLLEPAWNEPSLDQAKARAIRYKSHEHLPEEKRKVLVQKFLSTRPKNILQRMGVSDKEYAVDEYLKNLSKDKAELISQFENLMKPQEVVKTANDEDKNSATKKLLSILATTGTATVGNDVLFSLHDKLNKKEKIKLENALIQSHLKKPSDLKQPVGSRIDKFLGGRVKSLSKQMGVKPDKVLIGNPSVKTGFPKFEQFIKSHTNGDIDPYLGKTVLMAHAESPDASILHELGHIKNMKKIPEPAQLLYNLSRQGTGFLPSLGLAAYTSLKKDPESNAGLYFLGASAPTLLDEGAASFHAIKQLVKKKGLKKGLRAGVGLLPAFGTYALTASAPLIGTAANKFFKKHLSEEKTAKVQDEVDNFHSTKDYKLVMKNIASPKFRKLLIQASDDPRFHNFLNNLGKHNSGRQKEETQVKSSTKDIMYSVKKHKDDSYTCSCPDYLFKKSPDNKECKHIVSVKGHTKTAIIGTALLAGGLHFGTNAAMKALKNSHMGHSLESAQFATGMRNALQGKKLHPVAKDVMQYGIGPESMVSMDAGSLLGKHLSALPKAKQFKSLKKIRKAVGMTEAVKNAPIVKDVIPGINRHLSGNTSLLDKIPTVPIDQSTTKLQKAISLGLGAGAVAADPHSIVHMGINALRKGIGESSKGKEFMKNQFISGIKNKPLNPALSAITDIAISPAALDTRRIGEAAHKELQNPRLKNILSMLSGS